MKFYRIKENLSGKYLIKLYRNPHSVYYVYRLSSKNFKVFTEDDVRRISNKSMFTFIEHTYMSTRGKIANNKINRNFGPDSAVLMRYEPKRKSRIPSNVSIKDPRRGWIDANVSYVRAGNYYLRPEDYEKGWKFK